MASALQSVGDSAMMQVTAPPTLTKLGKSGNIDKAAQDFEGMFMSQMLQPMFQTLSTDPNFGGGHGEEVMKNFLVSEYGKIAAKTGSLGITAAVKSEMIKAQAAADGRAASAQAPNVTLTGGQNASIN